MLRSVWVYAILAAGLLQAAPPLSAAEIPVTVSILPQSYFVRQIGGDKVDVQVMVQPGASPATYEPKPGQMVKLAASRLYFSIGVPFETVWLDKLAASNPEMTIIATDEGIEKQPMASHNHPGDGDHGHETDHDHEADHEVDDRHVSMDPHIWLSPPLVKRQCIRIRDALSETFPSHRDFFWKNYAVFAEKIDKLDSDIKRIFNDRQGMQFMVFHPSWGYFARSYGLTQIPVEIEGKNPKPSQLKDLIEYARSQGISVIFVQPQFSLKSARIIAREINGNVVVADPLAEDWLTNLKEVAGRFRDALN